MPRSLKALEVQRERLFQQLQALGDFRPGNISVKYRKCGRKSCARAHPSHRGHGPQFRWNTTQGGKSRAQSLHLGSGLEKARQELENHDRSLRWCQELVAVNEQIRRIRPGAVLEDASELEALRITLRRRFSRRWRRK